MSNSLYVKLPNPQVIPVDTLVDEASRIAKVLLCQADDFKLDIFFTNSSSDEVLSNLSLYKSIYLFEEARYLDCGAYISYDLDEYSEFYEGRKIYDFSILEIPAEKSTLLPIVCVCLAIAVANMALQSVIFDYEGFWSLKSDEVKVEELMALANPYFLPLDKAISFFYRKIPIHE